MPRHVHLLSYPAVRYIAHPYLEQQGSSSLRLEFQTSKTVLALREPAQLNFSGIGEPSLADSP